MPRAAVPRYRDPVTDDATIARTILTLLGERRAGATICPSEVARALTPTGWRSLMPRIRLVGRSLALSGEIEIRQKGQTIDPGQEPRGPIRLALRTGDQVVPH